MSDWELEDDWDWDLEELMDGDMELWTESFADLFFLSDNDYLPHHQELYNLGFLEPGDWEPLLEQLEDVVDLDMILDLAEAIQPFVQLPGLPVQLLETPLYWLEKALGGGLPPEPSGRKVGSRKLVQLATLVLQLAQELPDTARAAIRIWAGVHRDLEQRAAEEDDEDALDMPPAVAGFSMMIAMSIIRWPERAEGIPLPPDFAQPELYEQIMEQWEELPDGLVEETEVAGEAEALFAQGQLAHMLAQMDTSDEESIGQDPDAARVYSRLSRAILWIHNQCRHCPARDDVTCTVAVHGPEHPVPLLDVAGQIANTGRIEGCIKM